MRRSADFISVIGQTINDGRAPLCRRDVAGVRLVRALVIDALTPPSKGYTFLFHQAGLGYLPVAPALGRQQNVVLASWVVHDPVLVKYSWEVRAVRPAGQDALSAAGSTSVEE